MRKLPFISAIIITIISFFIIESVHEREMAYVENVIDGDTIKTDKGTIRLAGINAPEKGQPYYQEAKDFLAGIIEGKNVTIEGRENDRYGRMLRYVYLGNVFVNLEILKSGYGSAYMSNGLEHENEILSAEETAKKNNVGIWKNGAYSHCLSVSEFIWDAKGNDNINLNGEYFTIKNRCNAINMEGWTIKDSGRNIFRFSNFAIDSVLTVYTGCGNNTQEKIYMCKKRAVWNNDGDVLFIRDENGNLVLSYDY